jgi:Tol biopolymer transport system component
VTSGAGRLLILVICLPVVAGAALQASPEPAILYERGGDLYAVAADGSRTVRLTKTRVAEAQPAVSRDGRTIAVQIGGSIWTMRVNGTHRVRITAGHDDGGPAWPPTGWPIYFSRYHGISTGASCGSIFRIDAARAIDRVTDTRRSGHSHDDPAVSPDGRRIAFSDWNACEGGTASPRLRVVDPAGKPTRDLRRLRRNGYYPDPEHSSPAWSPDGKRLAFMRNSDLAVANRDGSGERRLARGFGLLYQPPGWSPDGRWIVFVRESRSYAQHLWIVHPDGSGLRRVTRTKGDYRSPAWLPSMPR